ncbi:MAG: PKD domain-containing protein [Methylobacter sp.]
MNSYIAAIFNFFILVIFFAFSSPAEALTASSSDSLWQIINTSPTTLSSLAVQSDGQIVSTGYKQRLDQTYSFSTVRMSSNGSIDMSFGTNGIVSTAIGSDSSYAKDVAIQSDGKIVVAGSAVESNDNVVAVVRYSASGELDPSFGNNGIVTKKIRNSYPGNGASNVVLQDNGKIIVVGNSYRLTNNGQVSYIDVCRFNSDGSIDTSFGIGGEFSFLVNSISSIAGYAGGKGVSTSSNGDIFIAGNTYVYVNGIEKRNAFVAKVTSVGTLDTSFGNNGIVIPAPNYNGWLSGLSLQSDGKIVTVGNKFNSADSAGIQLYRFSPDGSLDSSFGVDGDVFIDLTSGNEWGTSVVVDKLGRLILGGMITDSKGFSSGSFVLRLTSDGSIDASYGTNGIVSPKNQRSALSLRLDTDNNAYIITSSYTIEKFIGTDPVAEITVSININAITGNPPLTVSFSGIGSSSIKSDTLSYTWEFGDGSFYTGTNPTHTFNAPGIYTARLTGKNASGQSAVVTKIITLTNTLSNAEADCLFSWGEDNYPSFLFPKQSASLYSGQYYYRYYSGSGMYIGISSTDNHLYLLNPTTGLQDAGLATMWSMQAKCR